MDHYRVDPAYIELRSDIVSEWSDALNTYIKELDNIDLDSGEEQFYIASDWTLTIIFMPYPGANGYLMMELDPEAWRPSSQIS